MAPLDISKKNPLSLGHVWRYETALPVSPTFSTQLFVKTASTLPTSYQMPFEKGRSVTRLSLQVTR